MLIFVLFKGVEIPGYHLVYFLFLSAVLVATAIFYTPFKFAVHFEINSLIKEYIKLAVVFLYFLIGYNLINRKIIHLSIKCYSYTALFVGILGILISVLGLKFMFQLYDFGVDRFNGFMNDPNYFAIVQISALPFFLRAEKISLKSKIIIYSIILTSILLSGSKTGIITLILYTFMFIFGDIFKKRLKVKTVLSIIITIVTLALLILFFGKNFSSLIENKVQFQRISLIFTDFNAAFNNGGSSRLPIWNAGFKLISLSPFVGVGVGMYSPVSEKVSGIDAVAHNTYIQTYSEWGGIFATTFFLYLTSILLKVTFSKKLNNGINPMLRDILIILLIGSIAVSFNNARMFWFFLGALVYSTSSKHQVKASNNIS